MINLSIQFKLIIFSFSFGFLFSGFLEWFNKILIKFKSYLKMIISLVTLIFITILYFIGIQKIGYAIFHIYEILSIVIGFITYDIIIKLIAK